METRRTRRVNDHQQRKLDIAKDRMRAYLLEREIDGWVHIKGDEIVVNLQNSYDHIHIPIACRGVNVVCISEANDE